MPIRLICRHRRFSQRKMEYEVCRIEIKGSTQYKRWRMGQWHRNVFYIFDIVSLSRNNWLQVVSWCHAILPSVTAKTAKYKQKKIRNVKKYIFLEMRISLPHLAKINHWLFFYLIESKFIASHNSDCACLSLYRFTVFNRLVYFQISFRVCSLWSITRRSKVPPGMWNELCNKAKIRLTGRARITRVRLTHQLTVCRPTVWFKVSVPAKSDPGKEIKNNCERIDLINEDERHDKK